MNGSKHCNVSGLGFKFLLSLALGLALTPLVPALAGAASSLDSVRQATVEVRGIFSVRSMTQALNKAPWMEYFLETPAGRQYQLFFKAEPGRLPLSGSEVLVSRAMSLSRSGGTESLLIDNAQGQSGVQILKESVPNATGPQSTAFILVNFSDKPLNKPWSIQEIQNIFDYLSDYLMENSYGQTYLTGDVLGWYTVNLPSDNCNGNAIADEADKLVTAAGIVPTSYSHRVYIYPGNCNYMGWGYVGTPVGGSSRAVVNAAANLYTIGHQLGHGLGVWNANALYCGSRSIGTGAECSGREGGDPSDIMGYGYAGHMNAVLKEQLGWLGDNASPPITEITASQTFKLEPYEVKTPNAKALKVLKSTNADGSSDFYYLEYRQPIGFDSSMPWPGFLNGVLIHSGNSKNMNSSYLLDMTPGDGNFTNAALLPGKTFTDTNAVGGGVSITVDSVGPSGANLTFKFGSKARSCMYSAPVLKIEPDSVVWVQQGQDFVYDVDVSSLQTAECQEEEYSFLLAVPSGVSAELSQKSIALREGTHATLKLTVHASSTITDGIYDIVVVGQNTKDLTLVKSVTAKLGIQVAGLN